MKFNQEFTEKESPIYSFNLCWIFLTAIPSTFVIDQTSIYRRGIQQYLDKYFSVVLIATPSVANLMNRKVDRKAVAKKIEKLGCY
jgi:hypothetical protein